MIQNIRYKDLARFSSSIGISPESLVAAFEIESEFHRKVLAESSREERLRLYADVYEKVHLLYQEGDLGPRQESGMHPRVRKARLFKKEIANKSVLEVGCGQGAFLMSLLDSGIGKNLQGMDVTIPGEDMTRRYPDIEFFERDITKFSVDRKFDVVYSNHVLEHVAPADLETHLSSVYASLNGGGTLIMNVPNRLFGPNDVTRIVDFSNTNRISAMGSHLNESTYTEIIEVLKAYGFTDFRTTFPNIYLRHLIPNFRMSPALMCWLENSPIAIDFLHMLKLRGRCIVKLEITLICRKGAVEIQS